MTGWVVALRWLTPLQAQGLAGAAVLLNWVILPATGLDRRIRREGSPFVDGVKLYPVAVLLALLLFDIRAAAAAWAVLGVGDSLSNLLGRQFGRPPFLGRTDRSAAGSAAFLLTAWPAAWAAALWVGAGHDGLEGDPGRLALAALAAAAAGTVAELVPLPRGIDDNLPIALAAGAAFVLAA